MRIRWVSSDAELRNVLIQIGADAAIVNENGAAMSPELLKFLLQCIADDNLHAFYTCWEWVCIRTDVLKDDKYECQKHKAKGKYKKATTVHHVKHVRQHPELALSKQYTDEHGNKPRQLISLCRDCHEEEHPERALKFKQQLNEERW